MESREGGWDKKSENHCCEIATYSSQRGDIHGSESETKQTPLHVYYSCQQSIFVMHQKYNICQSCSYSSPLGGEVPGACQQLPRRSACASRVRIRLIVEALNHLGFSCKEQKRVGTRER